MRISTIASGALAATLVTAQGLNQSEPFNLVIVSDNSTINGSTLNSCHEGAAIEALCPDFSTQLTVGNASAADVYNFNFSASDTSTAPGGVTGLLTYFLPLAGDEDGVSSAMQLSYNPVSNVAVPLFFPGTDSDSTYVAFDECDKLNIQGYVDDTTDPLSVDQDKAYYRWYVCETIPTSYTYTTLAWALGNSPPENPSCQKVDIQRLFV